MKQINLHTDGNEYLLDGEDYIGYYNITDDGMMFTGRSFDDKTSQRLTLLSPNMKKYGEISSTSLGDSPTEMVEEPTNEDYDKGWFYRYFAYRVHDLDLTIFEIDSEQYDMYENKLDSVNHQLYKPLKLRWKISGKLVDIISTNKRTVEAYSETVHGLDTKLNNYSEFSSKRDKFVDAYTR